jgi:arylsulfatase A-like enzyme
MRIPILALAFACGTAAAADRPNVVLIVADDLGYGDLACYGNKSIRTPHLDRLAKDGTRLTSFYVAQPVCTASRAALMTGCYPNRVGLQGALNHKSLVGIHTDETTLAELFKSCGYATACYGKWHLGHRPPFLPTRNGFDEFFGIPYSNDNGPLHPVLRDIPSLPLYDGEKVVETDPDQRRFTRRLTDRAVTFIDANRNRPFLLYVPHVMPHVPIHVSDAFNGKSKAGLYGDVIEELDAGVGDIVAALEKHGLREKTLVVFMSDNGPFLSYGDHAGSAGPLREGKLTTFEGGVRVPCIVSWPGTVPTGRTSDEIVSAIDLYPTLAGLIGAKLPTHRIDGVDVWPFLSGKADKSPRDTFLYYAGEELQAVRLGKWKLHFPHDYLTIAGPPGRGGKPANFANMKPKGIEESGLRGIASRHGYEVKRQETALYDLTTDTGERLDVARDHPAVVQQIHQLAARARDDLGDSLTRHAGKNVRMVGRE